MDGRQVFDKILLRAIQKFLISSSVVISSVVISSSVVDELNPKDLSEFLLGLHNLLLMLPALLGLLHGVAHPHHLAGHLTPLTVAAQVFLHVCLLLEALATHRAGKGPLSRVDPPVLTQVVLGSKLFSTHRTVQQKYLKHWPSSDPLT